MSSSHRHVIVTRSAPQPVGPYSQAVRAGDTLYISGQLGLKPDAGALEPSIREQAEQALTNVFAITAAAGLTPESLTKITCYLASMDDFGAFNEVYAKYMPDPPPARSCIAVKTLPKNALIEVEAIAVAPADG